jgi:F-type H+-transporting ATPase subunit gamma
MPDTKKLRNRIKSVNSTLHLTHAMELVASSKIRRATQRMETSGEHAEAFQAAMDILAGSGACSKSLWLRQRDEGKTLLVVIAGDRGLAGGYNANIFRFMRDWPDAEVIPVGKRSCDRYGGERLRVEGFSAGEAEELAGRLCEAFRSGEAARVGVVYTRFVSILSQVPELRWLLPLTAPEEGRKAGDMIFEPDPQQILEAAVPAYVAGVLAACARESFACEVCARRNAMDSAGKNAREMIDTLQLQYNRARQGAITQESTEIVAGGSA